MTFTGIMNQISIYAIPVMILGIVLTGIIKKVKVYASGLFRSKEDLQQQ